jgi:hypothetical protein
MSSLGQLVKFVPVLERACRFYAEGVRLILDVVSITLPYAAG